MLNFCVNKKMGGRKGGKKEEEKVHVLKMKKLNQQYLRGQWL
jgi:hypothetical protein